MNRKQLQLIGHDDLRWSRWSFSKLVSLGLYRPFVWIQILFYMVFSYILKPTNKITVVTSNDLICDSIHHKWSWFHSLPIIKVYWSLSITFILNPRCKIILDIQKTSEFIKLFQKWVTTFHKVVVAAKWTGNNCNAMAMMIWDDPDDRFWNCNMGLQFGVIFWN